MVIKITNKDERFYQYMGRFFGSRLVERQTNDRIYDDDDKIWYVYLDGERVMAFVSMNHSVIKNIYTTREQYLEKILDAIQKETTINCSIVTNYYVEAYEKCGLKVNKRQDYKNFVTIYTAKETVTQ